MAKLSILVVENDVAVLSKVTRLLTGRGYNVAAVEDHGEALNTIQKNPGGIDIALLSLELPRLGAMHLLKTLQKTRSEILVMVMSAGCGEEGIEAIHAGAYDCIRKTFTMERFWTKMDRAIERCFLKKELERLKRERKSIHDYSMRDIFNSMADGILVTDLHGHLVFCNSKAASILDLSRDEDLGRPIHQLLKYKELERLLVNSTRFESAISSTGYQEVCLLEVGDDRLQIHISPVINGDGEPIGTVALLHDVRRIAGMDSLKKDFVFMVSHQLKAPLSAMLMQLSVVLDGLAGDLSAKQKGLLGKAKERIKGMIALVSDLLDFQRIEEGKVLQKIVRIDLREILERTIELMAMLAEDKDITVETHVADDLPFIIGDRNGIEVIFVNLISNAIKYTPNGGQVTVDIYRSGEDVRIKVVDTGIGMARADVDRIFDKFYRIRSEITKHIAGSGLGLSIVKRIIDLHRGSVHVESEENKGTTFIVTLPVAK